MVISFVPVLHVTADYFFADSRFFRFRLTRERMGNPLGSYLGIILQQD